MSEAWAASNRKETLPGNWRALRSAVFQRDGNRCVIIKASGRRCWDRATDCDHIGDRDDHSIENLRSLCSWHHQRRSSQQGNAARAEKAKILLRPKERHPGLLPEGQKLPPPKFKGF